MSNTKTPQTFTIGNLPDLDTVVLWALELFQNTSLPDTTVPFRRPLVVGSGNAEATGRIIFAANDAVFASESSYLQALSKTPDIDGAIVISASGSKHAIEIAKTLKERDLPMVIFTNNTSAPAASFFEPENVRIFPKNREPYTYNTSTYLGMILADTGEDSLAIKRFIESTLNSELIPTLSAASAFTFILPSEYSEIRAMLRTKFDELFGPKVMGRFFIPEELKHAKTVVSDPDELFINFTNISTDRNELRLSLPEGYAGALATAYFLVGLIQQSKPSYFKNNIIRYCDEASAFFNQEIKPIVE